MLGRRIRRTDVRVRKKRKPERLDLTVRLHPQEQNEPKD
jgi:hypothetical protein